VFDALERHFAGQARFVWLDIEEDAAVLGDVDVEDFPTLLIADGDTCRFFGPVTPHGATARALVQRALRGELPPLPDEQLHGLPRRLRALSR
jgi:hypothetical protein